MSNRSKKVKVIPCSGIGKVVGLMARETAFVVTEELAPETTEAVCLAHIVTGDDDAVAKVNGCSCITVDGCAALCAAKSVEHLGGIVKEQYRVINEMRKHRGKQAGDGTALSDDGWDIVNEFGKEIKERIDEIVKEAE